MVLMSTAWPRIRLRTEEIRNLVGEIGPGEFVEVTI